MDIASKPGSCLYGALVGVSCLCSLWVIMAFLGALAFGGTNKLSLTVLCALVLITLCLLIAAVGTLTEKVIFSQLALASSTLLFLYVSTSMYGFLTDNDARNKHILLLQLGVATMISASASWLSWVRIRQLRGKRS